MMRDRRHGYTLMLVLVFLVLMLSLASVAYRQVSQMLRIESVRTLQVTQRQGSVEALARALALLETGTPPTNPSIYGVIIETATGPRAFTVTMSSTAIGQWTVHAAPTPPDDSPETMPSTF